MRPRRRIRPMAVAVVTAPLLGGCGLVGAVGPGPGGASTGDAAATARERVQSYLDAVKAKDVAQGRSQFCAVLQDRFDAAATGPNGDFAPHFTVAEAAITGVRADDARPEVDTTITVNTGGTKVSRTVVFSVAKIDGAWCIAGETLGGAGSGDSAPGGAAPGVPPVGAPTPVPPS